MSKNRLVRAQKKEDKKKLIKGIKEHVGLQKPIVNELTYEKTVCAKMKTLLKPDKDVPIELVLFNKKSFAGFLDSVDDNTREIIILDKNKKPFSIEAKFIDKFRTPEMGNSGK